MSARPFEDLRPTGLLWLINTTVFHPRGYALALHFNDDGSCSGWSLMGDGSEVWQFTDKRLGEAIPAGYMALDERPGEADDFILGVLEHVIVWEGKPLSGHHRLIDGGSITSIQFYDDDDAQLDEEAT